MMMKTLFKPAGEHMKLEYQRKVGQLNKLKKQGASYASQGGPIILSQVENEYGNVESSNGAAAKPYVNWAAAMATSLKTGVPLAVKPLYLQYAKLEEDHGLAKRAMRVYDQATKAVPPSEKLSMYQIYIARAAEIFGVPKTREIYEQAIESGLPDKDAKTMCLKYAELEKSLGAIDRSRGIYKHASEFADPRSDADFWSKWHDFEVQHGNEDTFREMLRIKRSVTAKYSQVVTYSAKALTKPSLMHTQPAKLLPLWRQQFLSPPSYKYPQTICGYSFQEILREHVVYWDLSLLCLYQHNQGRFHLVGLTVHGLWESRLRYTLTYDNSGPKYIVEIIHLRDRPDQGEWERRLNNLARELSQIPQHVRAEMDKVWISNIHNANDWTVWIKERMLHGYALPNYWETVLNLSRRFVSKDSSGNIMKVMLQYNFVAGIFKVEDLKACLQKNYGFKMGVKLKEPRNQNQHYVSTVMLDEFRVLHDQALQIVDYPAQEKNKYFVLE